VGQRRVFGSERILFHAYAQAATVFAISFGFEALDGALHALQF
jgi:hypothetical protein